MHYNILSTNAKLEKSVKFADVLTAGLALAPHKHSGSNLCPNAGYCAAVCNLWFSGRTVSSVVRSAMTRRAQLFLNDRDRFMAMLREDLDNIVDKSCETGKPAYVRLNTSTDLEWESVIAYYHSIRFYDYTKIGKRIERAIRGDLPQNYSITPSYSERMTLPTFRRCIDAGLNVSVIFDTTYHPQSHNIGRLPCTFRGVRVVDGDTHDLRHPDYDGHGNVIGLRFKGSRKLMGEATKRGLVIAT